MWVRFETYHDVTYFTPESLAANAATGSRGGWAGYFGTRAAPLGAASPELVTALFYTFHPAKVARAVPAVWATASPQRYLEARLAGADAALRRMLGDDVTGPEVAEAAALAREAAEVTCTAGRPLAAANRALPWPEEPHLVLWQACTVLREARGDGHVAALVAAGIGPCEALVLFGADTGLDAEYLRGARGWPEASWQRARHALADRGLFYGGLTSAGAALRADVERRTDEVAEQPWTSLGARHTERLRVLLTPLTLRIARQNDALKVNPMALDPVREMGAD
ncbi:SCO6745 family protein [Umezawaea beigongshangensis]|uniref:SCO6745 family protein n=1 Tax=Umezawaea beigongshangensis TaxID=2780383 RepID=UPI0018F23D25|nr:hypothetical protein [Umezawaea beigongshangensis]